MLKVAIVIPTLNEEKFIAHCLDSVIAQSFPMYAMDVMVIDGGSIDHTKEIVEGYHAIYPNIRFLDNPGKIQSIAFNIGVKSSNAPYIIRLDAHATYDKAYIKSCLEKFSANAELLGCRPELLGNVGGVCSIRPQHSGIIAEASAILNQSRFGIGGAAFRVGTSAGFVDTVPFGCFPRKVIEIVGGMREDLPRGEDNEFNSRIRKFGYKIYLDPKICCTYYSRDTLQSNMRQMYANGESIGHLFYVDVEAIGFRHLIPLFFVLCIIMGIIMSIVWHPFLYLLLAGVGVYFLCDFVACIISAKKYGIKYFFPLLLMFFCVHISYGLGTIVGIFNGGKLKKTYQYNAKQE